MKGKTAMKIVPTSLKRAYAIKKIAQRDAYKQKYICISPKIQNKEVFETLKANEQQLGRIIKKKPLALEFTRGEGLFENSTVMNIHDVKFHFPKSEFGLPFTTLEEKVGHFIPEELKGKALIEYIKKLVKQ